MNTSKGWITNLPAIAYYMDICRDTLISWMKKYDMPITKVGRKWIAIPSDLDEWLKFPRKNRPKNTTSKTPPLIPQ